MNRLPTPLRIVLGCLWIAVACGGCGKSPATVTADFVTAWDSGRYPQAQLLMSRAASAQFETVAAAAGGKDQLIALLDQNRLANPNRAARNVDVSAVTVIDDKATAHYTVTDQQGNKSQEREMDLVKENGQWKIDFERTVPWARVPGIPRTPGAGGPGAGGRGQGRGGGRRGTTQPAG